MGEGLSVEQATIQQLQALLKAQNNLRQAAEKQAKEAMSALKRVAEGLAPAELDRMCRESTTGLSKMTPDQIADLVLTVVRRRLARLEAVVGVDPEELEALREELVQLRRQAKRRPTAQPSPPQPPREPPESTTTPEPPKPPPPPDPDATSGRPPWMPLPFPPPLNPVSPMDAWPRWAQKWRKESGNYERDVDVILVLGDTGIARREAIDKFLAEWWGISSGSGSMGRAISRVREVDLVEAVATRRERGRYPRHLLRLTERGQDAYRLIRGEDPAPSQTTELLKRHKSPEHAALNLEAAMLLWASGYAVELFPDEVKLDTGTYYPDLAIPAPGEGTLYVECERDTRKRAEERERKWDVYYTASGGYFLVITPTEEDGKVIREEILTWAGERSLTLWMASVQGKEQIEWE